MKQIIVYTTTYCPYCKRAKSLLDSLGLAYEEIDLTEDDTLREKIIQKYQWQTVPVIVIDGVCIGGYDDLFRLHAQGGLK
jgi:GrxC family glutaredoxin